MRISEGNYNAQVMQAALAIKKNVQNYRFVLLCGPSASGKTTTAHKLKHRLEEVGIGARVISMDDFFLGPEHYPKLPDGKLDLESIECVDLSLLNQCFIQLLRNRETWLPEYNFAEQSRVLEANHISFNENEILIMEGIHALNPRVLSDIPLENKFRLYVSVRTRFLEGDDIAMEPSDIRLTRRLVRDYKFRGYSPLKTLEQWQHVRAGERANIYPYRDDVDLKMDNTIDYEICVWHELLQTLLDCGAQETYRDHPELQNILKGLERFASMDYRLIPRDSLLREFIGTSI